MLQSTIHQVMKLSDDSGLFYKAYCQDGLSREPKVKKFMVDKDVTTNYLYLRSKLMEVFPILKTVSDFTIHWLDNEGDKIEIGSDEELVIALSEQIDLNVKKLYVTVAQATKSSDLSGPVHEGVECDGCNSKVTGFRYKCISCVDFDLCESCENQRLHPDHFMLRVPVPTTLTGHCLGRKLGKRLHRYSRRQECRGAGGYKQKESGDEGSRGNKESEPDQGIDWVENLFKVIYQFGQTGLNHAATISQAPVPSTSTEQNLQNTLQNLKQNFANFVDPLGFLPPAAQSSNKATGTPMETETQKTPEPEVILIDIPSTSAGIPSAQQEPQPPQQVSQPPQQVSQPPQQATNSQQTSPTERSWILVEPNPPNKPNEEVLPTIAPEQSSSQEQRPATSSQEQRPTTSQQDQRPIGFNLPIHPAVGPKQIYYMMPHLIDPEILNHPLGFKYFKRSWKKARKAGLSCQGEGPYGSDREHQKHWMKPMGKHHHKKWKKCHFENQEAPWHANRMMFMKDGMTPHCQKKWIHPGNHKMWPMAGWDQEGHSPEEEVPFRGFCPNKKNRCKGKKFSLYRH